MKSSIVIGANYGDEGKGLMTDFLCKKYDADLVVRFNGGAQAGHTVVTPQGERHVFSHVGSGYFLGVPTYLSEYFILNPIVYKREMGDLCAFKRRCDVYVSPRSEITTYWDMLGNRVMEELRGGGLHGSCGIGINATLDRAKACSLNFAEIREKYHQSSNICRNWMRECKLANIELYWFMELEKFSRMAKKPIPDWAVECFDRGKEINERFVDDIDFMFKTVIFVEDPSIVFMDRRHAVFEGAQGLALDQFYGNFPYVTRSNTGIRNVLEMKRECQNAFSIDEIIYVSRTYETRHGNDPDFTGGELEGASDKTNVKNEWQGEIRYRKLLFDNLADRIRIDLQANNLWNHRVSNRVKLAITHTDQIPLDGYDFMRFNNELDHSIPLSYKSNGETRNDVEESAMKYDYGS